MYQESVTGACLTIVEFGTGETSAVLDSFATVAESHATVVQQSDETPSELAVRAIRKVEQLTHDGVPLVLGAIVASDDVCDDVFQARCQIARAMIRGMRGAESAKLTLSASNSLSAEGRHELLAIAGTLASQLRGLPVDVSVRFDNRRLLSSTRIKALEPVSAHLHPDKTVDVA